MSAAQEIPVISADAGDPAALSDPNSPASIMKKAEEQKSQQAADMKYDAQPPARSEGFERYVEVTYGGYHEETAMAMFLALSVLLFMYAAAP